MDLLKSISLALALAVVSLSVSPTVRPSGALWAQMHMPHPTSGPEAPLGIPETRLGSGTSWLPDSSPMHASHFTLGAWTLMVHGSAFLQYDRQGGTRGEDQVALLDWAMLAASRSLAGGQLDLRGMLSTDPWGVGSAGSAAAPDGRVEPGRAAARPPASSRPVHGGCGALPARGG